MTRQDEPVPKTFTFDGQTRTISQWADHIGIGRETLRSRIRKGWTLDEALRKERRPRPTTGLRMLTHDGETKPASVWSRERNIKLATISRRLGLGWTHSQALGFEPGPMALMLKGKETDE